MRQHAGSRRTAQGSGVRGRRARLVRTDEQTVRRWRKRHQIAEGIPGLEDRPRPGAEPTITNEAVRARLPGEAGREAWPGCWPWCWPSGWRSVRGRRKGAWTRSGGRVRSISGSGRGLTAPAAQCGRGSCALDETGQGGRRFGYDSTRAVHRPGPPAGKGPPTVPASGARPSAPAPHAGNYRRSTSRRIADAGECATSPRIPCDFASAMRSLDQYQSRASRSENEDTP